MEKNKHRSSNSNKEEATTDGKKTETKKKIATTDDPKTASLSSISKIKSTCITTNMPLKKMPPTFRPGQEVTLFGLKGNGKKHNGKLGVVIRIQTNGRIKVRLKATTRTKIKVAVQPTNLVLLFVTPALVYVEKYSLPDKNCLICFKEIVFDANEQYQGGSGITNNLCCGRTVHISCSDKRLYQDRNIYRCCNQPVPSSRGSVQYVNLIKRNAKIGHAWAQMNLAQMYEDGITGVIKQSDLKQFYYLTLAANQGYPMAQHRLGTTMYSTSVPESQLQKYTHLVTRSTEINIKLQTLAANQGLSTSQFNMGNFYWNQIIKIQQKHKCQERHEFFPQKIFDNENGEELFQNARKWYLMCANHGDEESVQKVKWIDGFLPRLKKGKGSSLLQHYKQPKIPKINNTSRLGNAVGLKFSKPDGFTHDDTDMCGTPINDIRFPMCGENRCLAGDPLCASMCMIKVDTTEPFFSTAEPHIGNTKMVACSTCQELQRCYNAGKPLSHKLGGTRTVHLCSGCLNWGHHRFKRCQCLRVAYCSTSCKEVFLLTLWIYIIETYFLTFILLFFLFFSYILFSFFFFDFLFRSKKTLERSA